MKTWSKSCASVPSDALTTKALAKEELFEGVEPSEELLNLTASAVKWPMPGRSRCRHPGRFGRARYR